jgi:hypothetical protein
MAIVLLDRIEQNSRCFELTLQVFLSFIHDSEKAVLFLNRYRYWHSGTLRALGDRAEGASACPFDRPRTAVYSVCRIAQCVNLTGSIHPPTLDPRRWYRSP